MTRSTFLTVAAMISMIIGLFALTCPSVLIGAVKVATPSGAANAMARTVGVLIFCVGLLLYLVRNSESSDTLKAILVANLLLQLGMLPLDPIAYATGAFNTLGSFVPNTILHVVLACGFAYYLVTMNTTRGAPRPLTGPTRG